MATNSSILAWRIPRTEEPGRLVHGVAKIRTQHDCLSSFHFIVFPTVMYGCESWTIKKDKCRRIDAFKMWRLDSKEIKPVSPKGNQP